MSFYPGGCTSQLDELAPGEPARLASGRATLAFRTSGLKTVLSRAHATSPVRLLTPRNHGNGAWVFLASLGGGLVDGDDVGVDVDAREGASAFISTQASTKIYRSPTGCSQHFDVRVQDDAALALVPDPVVCFAGARYSQTVNVRMAPGASLLLMDGYTSGRAARGERWEFSRYASRTTVVRDNRFVLVDATRLDPMSGSIADRMGRFEVFLTLVAVGPRFASVRAAMLEPPSRSESNDTIAAASALATDGAILRLASTRTESAIRMFRPSFAALAEVLGDDPFARKW